jgi:phosphoglycolate phosphatase
MTNRPPSDSLNTQDLRILLWDLDGTLVRGRRLGSFKDYTVPMLQDVFGTAGCLHDLTVSGMTDLQIVEEALRGEGITREHISSRKSQLKESYIREMKRAVAEGAHVIEAMPGAHEALTAVDEHPRYLSALLTGNIEPAAHLKVEVAGLAKFFTLPGAFGDESFDRRDLPEKAVERINRRLGLNLPPEHFIVIGDTPNDVACARHFGTRVLAVGSGRIHSVEDLRACEPDAFLPNLLDVELFMKTLAEL